ncbi:MAG: bifunctional 3-(3-hydroxy-phenyl)propionate/3-hydroxycinnamic acid hydroxylase [Rhizobiaceae bacterium]
MKTDVLIVGAGPTGLLLANLLGCMGVKTIVAERNASTVDAPRAVSIDDESMRSLQAAGLSSQVQNITQKGYGSLYKGPAGKVFATVKPATREFGFDKRNAFQQPELEAILCEGLSAHRHVILKFGHTLNGIEQKDDQVTATLLGKQNRKITIHAKYMVGCDGGRSTTRKLLGVEMVGSSIAEPWLIVDLVTTLNRSFHTEVFCNADRPCITLPGPGGIRRYEFRLNAGETRDQMETESVARQLMADFGPDKDQPIRRILVYSFHARSANSWRKGRVFLAGDAAHLTPPFAGQGLNSGLRDAQNLAWKLTVATKSETPAEFLDSYELERKPHAEAMIKLALRLGAVMMPQSRFKGALTRSVFHMLGLMPAIKSYVSEMRFKPRPRFEKGLVWPDGKSSKKTIIGTLFPQPVIEHPNGKIALLDEIIGNQAAIILFSEFPDKLLDQTQLARLESIGIKTLGITPEWNKAVASSFPSVRDANRLLSGKPFADYLDHAILLRPDKYVAATAPADKISNLINLALQIAPNKNNIDSSK